MAGRTSPRSAAGNNGRGVEDSGLPLRPSERYRVTADEWFKVSECLNQAGKLQSSASSNEEGPSIGVGINLEGVVTNLLELFGNIDTYGLLFKLAAIIKRRVETMHDVEERTQEVAAQVEFIRESFEGVEIQFTLSHVSILKQATETFCLCAIVLQRMSVSRSGACGKCPCLVWIRNFLSASANQADLETCAEKLLSFRDNLSLALQTRPLIYDLPDLEGPPAVGIDAQIDEVLQFLGQANSDQGVSCVVSFYGRKGVGKSRLMFEVENRFPPNSTMDRFYTMNFADPVSRLYLQQGLVEHLQGKGTATALRSTDAGKKTIRRCLAFLKTKKKRVLFAFDNVGNADDLTSILPLKLSEELPAGSCILVSHANNQEILRRVTDSVELVFPVSRTCRHRIHWVTPLKEEDAKTLFCLHAGSLMQPSDESVVDEIVSRCEGLPTLLLKAVGQVGRADWQAVLDALTNTEGFAQVPEVIDEISDPTILETDKRLYSKSNLFGAGLDEELQNALDDILGLLSGWDWQTVEAILGKDLQHGKDLMKRLADKSLIYRKASWGNLAPVANITRYSGPGPWKTNVVGAYESLLHPSNGTLASLVELDHPESVTLDRIQGVKYLVLHNSTLDRSSSRHLADLRFLYWSVSSDDASGSRSFTFPFEGPDALPQLTLLIISGNLDVHQFRIPPELPRLILVNCTSTQELPPTVFVSRKLEELRLRDWPKLARLCLPGWNNGLQTLSLERCPALKTLPKAIAGLRALRTLELLSCDGLEELEAEGIGNLENLRTLSVIGCNGLAALPHDLTNVSTLRSLNLSFCSKLGEVLVAFDGLVNLEELDLTSCSSIRKLSPSISMLKSLTRLNLVGCSNLLSLPDGIGQLRNLQHLDMGLCFQVRTLPASLIKLESLRRLMLAGCSRLEELPKGLDELLSLEYLNLLGCQALDVSKHADVIQKLRSQLVVVFAERAGSEPHSSTSRGVHLHAAGSQPHSSTSGFQIEGVPASVPVTPCIKKHSPVPIPVPPGPDPGPLFFPGTDPLKWQRGVDGKWRRGVDLHADQAGSEPHSSTSAFLIDGVPYGVRPVQWRCGVDGEWEPYWPGPVNLARQDQSRIGGKGWRREIQELLKAPLRGYRERRALRAEEKQSETFYTPAGSQLATGAQEERRRAAEEKHSETFYTPAGSQVATGAQEERRRASEEKQSETFYTPAGSQVATGAQEERRRAAEERRHEAFHTPAGSELYTEAQERRAAEERRHEAFYSPAGSELYTEAQERGAAEERRHEAFYSPAGSELYTEAPARRAAEERRHEAFYTPAGSGGQRSFSRAQLHIS